MEQAPSQAIPIDLEEYGDPPSLPTLDISQEMVERVASTMGGKAGPGGVDAS